VVEAADVLRVCFGRGARISEEGNGYTRVSAKYVPACTKAFTIVPLTGLCHRW